MKVLLLADKLKTVDGITTHLYNLIKGLSAYNDIELFLICGKSSTKKLDELNINIITNEIFLHEKRNYFDFLKAFRYLRNFIKQNNIDIVHSHTHYTANIANQVAKNNTTIQTNHGLLKEKGRLKHFSADKYVATNEHIYDYLIQNKIEDKKNIYFIRCGIEMPEESVKKQTGKIKLFAASRLTHDKGLDIFIKAAGKLSDEDKVMAEFYIAGEGEEELNLKNLSNELNANVIFTGKIENMKEILTNSHVFVFPGRSDTEGFPASITEAAANNNLVISSNFFGADAVMKHNIDGLIFEKENETVLAKLLSDVINHYTQYLSIAEQFNKKVKTMYDLNTMAEKHYNMYNGCPAE
jgi:L-malate glycosyltransferase